MTKTKTQATSGEWLIDPDAPLDILAGWDTGPCIGAAFANADAGISQQQAEANARLMTASKRLYEALARALVLLDATSRFVEENPLAEEFEVFFDEAICDGSCLAEDCRIAAADARAALAAAEPKAGA